jgi:hypothetical protein
LRAAEEAAGGMPLAAFSFWGSVVAVAGLQREIVGRIPRMAEAHVGSLPEGTKACSVCREPINLKATKCIHCTSYQGFFGSVLGLGSTVFALLVALVTVVTTGGPPLIKSLEANDSSVSAAYGWQEHGTVGVSVVNLGRRAASVTGGNIEAKGYGSIRLEMADHSPAKVVEPAKPLSITLRPAALEKPLRAPIDAKCRLNLFGANFSGAEITAHFERDCTDFLPLVLPIEDK